MHRLIDHRMTPAFTSASLRPGPVPMGHLLNVDHFHMSEATFPPHPHAGFSAVTWMLPGSPGGFVTRDSRGDRSRIAAGSLHWTLAGSGMMHEEIPEVPGVDCEGLQIFVKLPEPLETCEPAAYHLDPDEVPTVDLPGVRARVLVGELAGRASPVPSHARTAMLHVEVDGAAELEVPAGTQAFAVVLRGEGAIDGAAVGADTAVALRAPLARLSGRFTAFLAWSDPMPSPPTFDGPFCMFRRERLAEARRAYAAGSMGRLSPSPARWVR